MPAIIATLLEALTEALKLQQYARAAYVARIIAETSEIHASAQAARKK